MPPLQMTTDLFGIRLMVQDYNEKLLAMKLVPITLLMFLCSVAWSLLLGGCTLSWPIK